MKEIGEKLKEAREAKGLSLEDISKQTKIRILYLRALENGKFDKLPFKVYVKGFLKAYAKTVALDSEELLNLYQEYLNQNETEEDAKLSEIPIMKSRSSKSIKKILIFIVILGILVAGFFFVKNLWEVIQNETIPQLMEPNENNQSVGDNSTTIEDNHTVADNASGTGESDMNNNLLDYNPLDQASTVNEQINNSENLLDNEPTIDNDTNATDNQVQDPEIVPNSEEVKTDSGELEFQENKDEKDAVEKNDVEITDSEKDDVEKDDAKKDDAKKDDAEKDDAEKDAKIAENGSNLNSNKNLVNVVDSNQSEQVKNAEAENVETEAMKTKSDNAEQAPIPTSENASNQNSIESQSIGKQKSTEIMVIANDTSWVRISNGKEVLFQGIMNAGDEKLFQGEKIQMRINNAAAIQVNLNGFILGPFGAKDQFVEKVFGE